MEESGCQVIAKFEFITPTKPFRLCATSEIASGRKLGIDATKKLPGECFKRPWPPLIKMDENVRAKVEELLSNRV